MDLSNQSKQMETTNNENEELKKIAPHFFKIEKKEVFEVPENYFEKLPGLMQDKMHAKTKAKNYWVPDYKLALAAASVCLLIFAGINYFSATKTENTELAASEMLESYDSLYLGSADESDLSDELDDATIEKTSSQIDKSSSLSNSDIEDYLLSENIDLTTITNEF